MHTHAYGHRKAPTRAQAPRTHIYSVPGLCFTRPGGREQISLASWLMPPAMVSHRQRKLMWRAQAPPPPEPHPQAMPPLPAHTHSRSCRLWASVWPGLHSTLPKGGRDTLASFPSLTLPSPHIHMDTHRHSNTQICGQAYSPRSQPPHPAGRWPIDRGHVAGRNASRYWALASTDLVPVCLPANYQPGMPHKNREGVLFSTLLIAAIALLSAPIGFWTLLLFLLAFLVSYGRSW